MKQGYVDVMGITINPMGMFYTVIIIGVCFFFYMGQKSDSKFNIWDAFMSEGSTSMLSIVFFGTWVSMTWVILKKGMENTLDVSFLNLYALTFAAPVVTRLVTQAAKTFGKSS